MANCISLIGNGPTVDQMKTWATASSMTDVLATKTLDNVCVVGNEIKADQLCCADLMCADVCALVLHECGEEHNKILMIQCPPQGIWDSDEGVCVCIEGFCLQNNEPECCGEDDLLNICQMMEDPCARHKWLLGVWYQRLSGKTILSASTPAGRSVTFVNVSAQCLKDEMIKAEAECRMCNPCADNQRCWKFNACGTVKTTCPCKGKGCRRCM